MSLLGFDLLKAARELYASEGPEGLSIRRLGVRAGASSAAMYQYWPSRDALLKGIAKGAWREFGADLRRHRAVRPARAQIAALTQDAIDYALANPHLWRLMFSGPLMDHEDCDAVAQLVYDVMFRASKEEGVTTPIPLANHTLGWMALLAGAVALHRLGHFDELRLRLVVTMCSGRILGLA